MVQKALNADLVDITSVLKELVVSDSGYDAILGLKRDSQQAEDMLNLLDNVCVGCSISTPAVEGPPG